MKKNCAGIVIVILLCFSDLSLAQISFKAGTFFDTKLTEQTIAKVYPIKYEFNLGLILGLEVFFISQKDFSVYSGVELRIRSTTFGMPQGHDINGKMVYSGYDVYDYMLGIPFVFEYAFPVTEKIKIVPLLGFDFRFTWNQDMIHFSRGGSIENIEYLPYYMDDAILSASGRAGVKFTYSRFFLEFNITPEISEYPIEHVGQYSFMSFNIMVGISGKEF